MLSCAHRPSPVLSPDPDMTSNATTALAVDTDIKLLNGLPASIMTSVGKGLKGTGCCNNWCYGKMEGEHIKDTIMDSVRKTVERLDQFMGIIATHSLAGGTGSGEYKIMNFTHSLPYTGSKYIHSLYCVCHVYFSSKYCL